MKFKSRAFAGLVALIVILSITGGAAIYFNHYSKNKTFQVFITNDFNSTGKAYDVQLPVQVSVQTQGLTEVGSAWYNITGKNMYVNAVLLAYYNSTSHTLDYISIISQTAMNNFSIPDSSPSQSISNGGYSLPSFYDLRTEFITNYPAIYQYLPGNFMLYSSSGYQIMELINDPFLASINGNTSGVVSVQFPAQPGEINPLMMEMHHAAWTFYDSSTASTQVNDTLYFVTGISVQALAGNNSVAWDLSATYLVHQGLFTNSYDVYPVNYTLTVNLP